MELIPLQPEQQTAAKIANKQDLPFNITTIASIDRLNTFATHNSHSPRFPRPFCKHRKAIAVSTLLLCVFLQTTFAATNTAPSRGSLIAYADKVLAQAREHFQTEPTNAEAAWKLGRACFELAALATNDTQKAEIAEKGIEACRKSILLNPDAAPPHLYLGMTIGQVADTKRNLAALRMVREMEHEFESAREMDEHFSYAGADRNLGLLYLQAPGWPVSIGSRSKARKHLERAAELAPESPENHLNLIEAYLKWGDHKEARQELQNLEAIWKDARSIFTGDDWAPNWPDWEQRLEDVRNKIEPKSGGRD